MKKNENESSCRFCYDELSWQLLTAFYYKEALRKLCKKKKIQQYHLGTYMSFCNSESPKPV